VEIFFLTLILRDLPWCQKIALVEIGRNRVGLRDFRRAEKSHWWKPVGFGPFYVTTHGAGKALENVGVHILFQEC